jgi:hypothetical protein
MTTPMQGRPVPPLKALFGYVFCLTCQHPHIPTMQVITFQCSGSQTLVSEAPLGMELACVAHAGQFHEGCGFGSWGLDVAEDHAVRFPDHIVHAVLHRMVPYDGQKARR